MERTRLLGPVQAIAWNGTFSSIAVSHCNNDVVIYNASCSGGNWSWNKAATLTGHHQMVSGLDWAPKADLILSCAHDRDAFVWTRSAAAASTGAKPHTTSSSSTPVAPRSGSAGGRPMPTPSSAAALASGSGTDSGSSSSAGWEKQMVITRLTKGALCVRWSPSEVKFAIGSAARIVSVGYYDPESKWWACKLIRKAHESSVVAVAWHPNSLMLATGSTDGKVRLFNAYVPGYEPEAAAGAIPPNSSFGDCLVEVNHDGCGWVHAVTWTPGDEALLYASHDSVVGFVRGPQAQVAVRLSGASSLPLKCLAAVSDRVAVGAGWEGNLLVLTRKNAQDAWQQAAVLGSSERLEGGSGSGGGGTPGAATPGGVVRQLAQMQFGGGAQTPSSGTKAAGAAGPGRQQTCHTACVTGLHVRQLAAASRGPGPRWHVASAGLDGQVVLWDLSAYLYV